ncbi:MAG: GNAT family N-acetyltransferase [bacterium]
MNSSENVVQDHVQFTKVDSNEAFPAFAGRHAVESFLHDKMQPFNDKAGEITRGIDFAFGLNGGLGGFVMLAHHGEELAGVLVMLKTGMSGFIPENILLYVGVDPKLRGHGIGRKLIGTSIGECEGCVKLHVEYDNPAKRLYERLGFTSKYAEMRLAR